MIGKKFLFGFKKIRNLTIFTFVVNYYFELLLFFFLDFDFISNNSRDIGRQKNLWSTIESTKNILVDYIVDQIIGQPNYIVYIVDKKYFG